MIEIIAGQYKFDVTNEVGIPLTYQIDDIKEIGSRNTSFSKTITLPGTLNNNKLFGMFFSPQKFIDKNLSLSEPDANVGTYFNPNISTDIQLFKDGMQIFTGTMKLLQVNKTEGVFEYEVALFGELGGLYFAIKNFNGKRLRLEDLGWNPTTLDTYDDSRITTWSQIGVIGNEEVVYPYINYANQISPNIEVRNYRPAYPLFGAFKKMFAKLGYTITGGWFDTDAMQNSIFIPNNNEKLLMYTNKYINDAPLNGTYNVSAVGVTTPLKMSGVGLSSGITFNSSTCAYTYSGANNLDLDINAGYYFDFTGGGLNSAIVFTLTMKINSVSIISTYNYWAIGNPKHINLTLNTSVTLLPSDVITFELNGTSNLGASSITTAYANGGITAISAEATTIEQIYNQPINYDLNCPRNVYMDELFTSFCKLFNLYVTESKYNKKELNIRPYIEFYSGNSTLNWSDKFDNENYKVLPISEITPNIYNFKWKPDKDYLNEKYDKQYGQTMADYIETSGFESAKGEEKIELMFSPSHIYGIGGDDKVTTGIFKRDAGGDLPINSNIRLVFLKALACDTYKIFDGATDLGSLSEYCYAGMTDDPYNGGILVSGDRLNLGFASPAEVYYDLPSGSGVSTSFYSIYWSPYIGEMIDSSNLMLNCRLNLDTVDLFRLNFANYINIHGIDYKLNAIKDIDVNQNEMAQVELIKVVDYIY
jgi:hypothetical protein